MIENDTFVTTTLGHSYFFFFINLSFNLLPKTLSADARRTFSLSQMNRGKLACTMSWREKVRESEPLFFGFRTPTFYLNHADWTKDSRKMQGANILKKEKQNKKKDLKSIGLNKYLFPLFRIITVRTNYLPTAENIYLIIILWLNKNSCYCQADRLLPFIEYSAGYIGEKQDGGSSTEDWWRSENKVKAYKRCPYGKSAINASTA